MFRPSGVAPLSIKCPLENLAGDLQKLRTDIAVGLRRKIRPPTHSRTHFHFRRRRLVRHPLPPRRQRGGGIFPSRSTERRLDWQQSRRCRSQFCL